MQRRSFFGGLFGGFVVWLARVRGVQAAPHSEILAESAALFVEGDLGRGTIAGLPNAKVIRYRDGQIVVYWHVTDRIYRKLDPFPETPADGMTLTISPEGVT